MRPVVTGYGIGPAPGVVRTAVAGGRPRYAMDYERGVQQFRVTLVLNPGQFTAWSVFYHRVIGKGALMWDMELDSGLGPMPHAVNMVPDTYQVVIEGGNLRVVSFVVEAESSAYTLSEEEVELILELNEMYGDRINRLLPRIDQFANVDLTRAFG